MLFGNSQSEREILQRIKETKKIISSLDRKMVSEDRYLLDLEENVSEEDGLFPSGKLGMTVVVTWHVTWPGEVATIYKPDFFSSSSLSLLTYFILLLSLISPQHFYFLDLRDKNLIPRVIYSSLLPYDPVSDFDNG